MSLLSGRLRQVSQPADDLDRAIDFYRDVLGLRLIARFGDLSFFDLDGIRLLLEKRSEGSGSSVLYLAVDNVQHTYRELLDRGVKFIDEPHTIFNDAGGTFGVAGEDERMVFFHDTEGNVLALSSRETPRVTP